MPTFVSPNNSSYPTYTTTSCHTLSSIIFDNNSGKFSRVGFKLHVSSNPANWRVSYLLLSLSSVFLHTTPLTLLLRPIVQETSMKWAEGTNEQVGKNTNGAAPYSQSLSCLCVLSSGSLIPRPHFAHPPKKWVWSTAYFIFVQVHRNAGTLFFSNLTLDVIEDCIPHCVPTIY